MIRHVQSIKISKFAISLLYLKKDLREKFVFFRRKIIINVFFKLVLSLLLGMATNDQSTQNDKFSKSLQYLMKKLRNEVIFCEDNYQSFQQVEWVWRGLGKVLRKPSMQYLCNISKKNLIMELIFCRLNYITVFCLQFTSSYYHFIDFIIHAQSNQKILLLFLRNKGTEFGPSNNVFLF